MAKRDGAAEPPVLEFERPVVELEKKIDELRQFAHSSRELEREIHTLQARVQELQQEIFADLTPWQKVLLSRHPGRPYTLDYLQRLVGGPIDVGPYVRYLQTKLADIYQL